MFNRIKGLWATLKWKLRRANMKLCYSEAFGYIIYDANVGKYFDIPTGDELVPVNKV